MPVWQHVPAQQPRSIPCPIAFVGEAPDDTSVCRGLPQVGPSGRLFDQMLRLADIDRADCWVGNVFDEKIPGNSIKAWCQKEPTEGTQYRIPAVGYLRPEFHWHFDRLREELAAARPAVIVPMGGTALWAFAGTNKITDARGAVARATAIVPGAKIVPTYHPMFVQHQYKAKVTVVADYRKAMAEAKAPAVEMILSPRELWLEPSLTDIGEFIERHLIPSELIGLDIETAAGQITCFGASADSERAICIPFVDYRRPSRSYWQEPGQEQAAWGLVRHICQLPNQKLFQNGPYDVFWLLQRGIKVRNWSQDTRLLHHALYPELPKTLAYMGSVYAAETAWKTMRRATEEKRDA